MRTKTWISGGLACAALALSALVSGPAAAAGGSDLVVQGVSANKTTALADEQIAVSASVVNLGAEAAGSSRMKYYFSADAQLDAGDSYLNYDNVGTLSVGAQSDETANVRVPAGTQDGSYFVLFVADYDAVVVELDESNNVFALPITVGTPAATADFAISAVSLSASQVDPNEVFSASCSVDNVGSQASGLETRLKYYLSSDTVYDSGDTYLNYDAVADLPAGGSSAETANLKVPAATADGLYYVLFVSDQTELVVETDELNNVHAEPLVVGSYAPMAELELANVSVPAPSVRAGETLDVYATAYNTGSVGAATVRLVYYLSTDPFLDGADKQLSWDNVDALAAGGFSDEDASLRVSSATDAGNYFVLFVLDADDDVSEQNESNNVVAVPVVVVTDDPTAIKADLVAQNAALGATTVEAGNALAVSTTIANVGVAEAGTSRLKYYLSSDSVFDELDDYLNYDNVGVLAVGAQSAESANLTIPANLANGPYYVLFVVDANKDVAETYESNNVVALPFTVGTPSAGGPVDDPTLAAPDLMVTDAWVDSLEVMAGDRASLNCEVENLGAYPAAASKVKYYLSADAIFDSGDDYVGYDNVPALAPGELSAESVTPLIPATTSYGTWYLLLVADAVGEVTETFESNNVTSVPIEVVVDDPSLDAPDLMADAPSLNKATVGTGFKLDVSATVHNLGSQPSIPSRVKLYLSDDAKHDGGDAYLAYRDLDVLATGADVSLSADVRIPSLAPTGPAFVLVVVDSERVMTESYESNNVLAIPVTIGSDAGPNPAYPYACPSSVFTDASLLPKHTVATLNALRLGWNNNKDMLALACIVSHFDLVGMVEVYDVQGMSELESELEALTSESWSFHISEYAVGDANGVEYYAYIWRDAAVSMTGTVGFYDDPGDLIKREPYGANFAMGAIDFTLVMFHLQYGNTITTRRLEAEQLVNVYDYFQLHNGSEQDVLIGGDLNLPADDAAFTLTGVDGLMSITDPEQKTTISSSGLANSFDHIFYPSDFTGELIGSGAHDYTQSNWGTVLETVTDHIPVWAELDTSTDDD